MNGKWLLSIGLPLVLMAGIATAAPLMYYDLRVSQGDQFSAGVTVTDPHTVVLTGTGNSVLCQMYVWVQDSVVANLGNTPPATGEPNVGVQHTMFGLKSSAGGLLGNISWFTNAPVVEVWQGQGYQTGGAADVDGDGDLDLGTRAGPFTSQPFDANFADFGAASFGGAGYNFWTQRKTGPNRWIQNPNDGATAPEFLGPDGNMYYGFLFGYMQFDQTGGSGGTTLAMYPFFYGGNSFLPHKFMIEGAAYNLNSPTDSNYAVGAPGYYVLDPAQFQIQTLGSVSIVPEPTVMCLLAAGVVGLVARRRKVA